VKFLSTLCVSAVVTVTKPGGRPGNRSRAVTGVWGCEREREFSAESQRQRERQQERERE
jgi:hypothetical protein